MITTTSIALSQNTVFNQINGEGSIQVPAGTRVPFQVTSIENGYMNVSYYWVRSGVEYACQESIKCHP